MNYVTLDYLPDLTPDQMSAARFLPIVSNPDPASGIDNSGIVSGYEPYALLHALYRFNAKEGATYHFTSVSFFDPFLLTVYDKFGNAVLANDESDDIPYMSLTSGVYLVDNEFFWEAPYTGSFYVNASWNQGTYYSFYYLSVDEDVDTALPPPPPPPQIKVLMPDGFLGGVGGNGSIVGTNEAQWLVLGYGKMTLDPSFNRGGDIIQVIGDASDYYISRSGSSAVLEGSFSTYTIPIGAAGATILFDDGARILQVAGGVPKIGDQTITATATIVTATGTEMGPLPQFNLDAVGRVFFEEGASASLVGDFQAIGTAGHETVTYLGGDLRLDPSFNRGGDTLELLDPASSFVAKLTGSSMQLIGPDGTVTVPVGHVGMDIDFAGDVRMLIYSASDRQVFLGDVALDANGITLG